MLETIRTEQLSHWPIRQPLGNSWSRNSANGFIFFGEVATNRLEVLTAVRKRAKMAPRIEEWESGTKGAFSFTGLNGS